MGSGDGTGVVAGDVVASFLYVRSRVVRVSWMLETRANCVMFGRCRWARRILLALALALALALVPLGSIRIFVYPRSRSLLRTRIIH